MGLSDDNTLCQRALYLQGLSQIQYDPIQSSSCDRKLSPQTRWLKSEQDALWGRIYINVLCSEASPVLFWPCSGDIYEVPDAHYTTRALMRNNRWEVLIQQQRTGLLIMEPKLPGKYDWIGFGDFYLSVFIFFIFSRTPHMRMYLLELVLILKWCREASRKFTFLTLVARPLPGGDFRGICGKWAAWDAIRESKWNVKLPHKKYWENLKCVCGGEGGAMWGIREGVRCCWCRFI